MYPYDVCISTRGILDYIYKEEHIEPYRNLSIALWLLLTLSSLSHLVREVSQASML